MVAEEARRKVEAETSLMEVKRTSLLLELGVAKDEVSFLHSQVGKDKEAMEEDYQKALEFIFSCGYEDICGDQLEVLNGMPDSSDPLPPKFFTNPGSH